MLRFAYGITKRQDGARSVHAGGQHLGVRGLVAAPCDRARLPRRVLLRENRTPAGRGLLRPDVLRRPPGDAWGLRRIGGRSGVLRCPTGQARPWRDSRGAGAGHVANRPGRDVLHHVLRAVSRGPNLRHARPSVAWSSRLECGHLGQRQRGAELRRRRPYGSRRALRPGRRVHGRGGRFVGHLGRRRDPA